MAVDFNLLGSAGDLYCFSNTLSMLVSDILYDLDFTYTIFNWHQF